MGVGQRGGGGGGAICYTSREFPVLAEFWEKCRAVGKSMLYLFEISKKGGF